MNVQADTAVNEIAAPAPDSNRWLALPILLTGAFLPVLDFNIVNLALPAIRADLGATPSEVQFVISGYAAAYAVFLITGGRLGDWFGRKRLFMLGVAGFAIASIMCGTARSAEILIASRILQGLTATLMAPQVLASIRVLFPADEQGKALAFYGATFGLANIAGQILGGVLVSAQPFGWPWQTVFLINAPIGLLVLTGSALFLRDSKAERAQKLDVGGVALLSLTLSLLVFPLIEGREYGWPSWLVAMLLAAPLFLAAFVRYENHVTRRGGSPLVEMSVFREPGFAIGIIMALLFYMLSSFYLTFSIYLQNGLHLTPLEAGWRTMPFGIGYLLASFASAAIMQRLGPRALTLGFVVQIVGFGLIAAVVAGTKPVALAIGLFTAGAGFGIVMPSVLKAILGGVNARRAGLASGVVISTFQIGAALGVATITGVFYCALGDTTDPASHAWAFAVALSCNIGLIFVAALLSLWLPNPDSTVTR